MKKTALLAILIAAPMLSGCEQLMPSEGLDSYLNRFSTGMEAQCPIHGTEFPLTQRFKSGESSQDYAYRQEAEKTSVSRRYQDCLDIYQEDWRAANPIPERNPLSSGHASDYRQNSIFLNGGKQIITYDNEGSVSASGF